MFFCSNSGYSSVGRMLGLGPRGHQFESGYPDNNKNILIMENNNDFNFTITQNQFVNLLQVLFIALKLLDKIDWGWFFVLLPMICWGLIVLIALILWIFKYINS